MGRLTEFYKQHRRLFLAQKHQNNRQTERFRDMVMLKFCKYCEFQKISHTDGINKKVVMEFFNAPEMLGKSAETRRKYFLVIREIYRRFFKINIGIEVLK